MSSIPSYRWRTLTARERESVLEHRKFMTRPWHSPPHEFAAKSFHLTAACFEHLPVIGMSVARLSDFSSQLLDLLHARCGNVNAWCVLPNHYHVLVEVDDLRSLLGALGQLHGRTSHNWNGEEGRRGRKVFHRAADRAIRSDRHLWASVNYIHNNPVHHGYVARWNDWPWSSAHEFLAAIGQDEAKRMWKEFPVREYGAGWDDPSM